MKAEWTNSSHSSAYENLFRVLIWYTQLHVYWKATGHRDFHQEMTTTKQCKIEGISFTINDDCMRKFQNNVSS